MGTPAPHEEESVSDDQQWRSPGDPPAAPRYGERAPGAVPPGVPPAPPPPEQPTYGQPPFGPPPYPQPPYGQPPYGQPPYGQSPHPQQPYGPPSYGPPGGWAPPPRPGLIPLRPLTLGTILGAPFQVLRRNPGSTFGVAIILFAITAIAQVLLVGLVTGQALDGLASANEGAEADSAALGAVLGSMAGSFVPAILASIAQSILSGILAVEVARQTLNERLTMRGLWTAVRGRLGVLVGWALLAVAATIVYIALAVGVVALVALAGGAAIALAIVAGVLLVFGGIALYLWLDTTLAFVSPALTVERLPFGAALRRSWRLVRRSFWRILGIRLLVSVALGLAGAIILAPVSLFTTIAVALADPNGQQSGSAVTLLLVTLIPAIAAIPIHAITGVLESATTALLYLDRRMRTEGLDADLARFVEARAAGDGTVPDPLLPASTPGAARA